MVKNESLRISETVNSLQFLDGIVLYDTGSTDDTIEIVKSLSGIPVHVYTGEFTNFAESRNKALEHLNECSKLYGYDYSFLLDANDELVCSNIDNVKQELVSNPDIKAWMVEQRLKYSPESILSFYNAKLIKCPTDLEYKCPVHEYLDGCGETSTIKSAHIFQDKTKDDNKSQQRWVRDKDVLEQELAVNPLNTRCLFYLAQTYLCLGDNERALEKYSERTKSIGGFEEERWQSYQQCGILSLKLYPNEYHNAITWFTKAYEHTQRAESLIEIAKIWRDRRNFDLAYIYASLACELPYPSSLLFVEKHIYDYERWHLLGIVAYYASYGKTNSVDIMKSGKNACLTAIKAGNNIELDTTNCSFYT